MTSKLTPTPKPEKLQLLKTLNSTPHDCLYRFFKEKSYADALLSGKVYISTLEACRGYDNAAQGDAGEGTLEYHSGTISGSCSDPRVQMIAQRSGIYVGSGNGHIDISNNTHSIKIPDAFVLCTTEKHSPEDMEGDFGRYCVRIEQPDLFFRKVTRRLSEEYHLRFARINKVTYSKRHYSGGEPMLFSHIGFVKPRVDIYASQNEVRMLWELASHVEIEPFSLECPEVKKFCSLV